MRLLFTFLLCILSLLLYSQNQLPKTAVKFHTNDTALQRLFNEVERKCAGNIQQFGKYKVLVEGAGYQNVWLETQPMGGYMYAKRDLTVSKNNQDIFMDYQRADGRLPGMISVNKGSITPHYGWFQGFCFPSPAFELYYWLGKDKTYLKKLYQSLEKFDAYLWKTRDSDGDGCLESWCVWDTGEDNSTRLEGAPNQWPYDTPPTKENIQKPNARGFFEADHDFTKTLTVPIESMDIMSYSFSARQILSDISRELGNGKEKSWQKKADTVRNKIKSYLWNEQKHACFDRDPENKVLPALIHNNLRCMYYGSFDQQMADSFVKYHLMNKSEFWTPMPLPSIAANDPLFRNISGNNWSGQPQGLTYQRAIEALENYGHYAEVTLLGKKLLNSTKASFRFTQQFNPYTGQPNNSSDGYGPTMLSVLEYISHMYGVHFTKNKIFWSSIKTNESDSLEYEQIIGQDHFRLLTNAGQMIAYINGKKKFSCTAGVRIVTNKSGQLLELTGIDEEPHSIVLDWNRKEFRADIFPNNCYKPTKQNGLVKYKATEFVKPW